MAALPLLAEPFEKRALPIFQGPFPWSNWLLPGIVACGAMPCSASNRETERNLTHLLGLGINTFICLQSEMDLNAAEADWRNGLTPRPYIRDAQRILSEARRSDSSTILQQKIDFLHLPIEDGGVASDHAMHRLADDCQHRILAGEKLYIHCWTCRGGHGRTGTLASLLIGRLYDLDARTALQYNQKCHDSRLWPQHTPSPETAAQRSQVMRLLAPQRRASHASSCHSDQLERRQSSSRASESSVCMRDAHAHAPHLSSRPVAEAAMPHRRRAGALHSRRSSCSGLSAESDCMDVG